MRKPIQPIVKLVKENAPTLLNMGKDYVKNNPGDVLKKLARMGGTITAGKNKIDKRPKHYRKLQYEKYQREIMPYFDSYSYIQLNGYKQEVENYLRQIRNEQESELGLKKPLHENHHKSWKQILIKIEDKIKTKNYEELLTAYHSPQYVSNYFEEKVILQMRGIENKDELHQFIHLYTSRNMKDIERDFF